MTQAALATLVGIILGFMLGVAGSSSLDDRAEASGVIVLKSKAYRLVPIEPYRQP